MPNVFDVYESSPDPNQENEEEMEGRWGRRIYGHILKDGLYTKFRLEMETSEGQAVVVRHNVYTGDLRDNPEEYGLILNHMTKRLENALERSNNTP